MKKKWLLIFSLLFIIACNDSKQNTQKNTHWMMWFNYMIRRKNIHYKQKLVLTQLPKGFSAEQLQIAVQKITLLK